MGGRMREPDKETKAAIIIAELALERAIHSWTSRWVLCYSGEGEFNGSDCACCITWEEMPQCHCLCHERIHELRRLFQGELSFYDDVMHSWMVGRHITGQLVKKEKE